MKISIEANPSDPWQLAVNNKTVARGICGSHQDEDLIHKELSESAAARNAIGAIKAFLATDWATVSDHTVNSKDSRDVAARGLLDGINNVTSTHQGYGPGVPPVPGRIDGEGGKVYRAGWDLGRRLANCCEFLSVSAPEWHVAPTDELLI